MACIRLFGQRGLFLLLFVGLFGMSNVGWDLLD